MDAGDNKALLGISIGGTGGFQFLDLSTDTFEPPFPTGTTPAIQKWVSCEVGSGFSMGDDPHTGRLPVAQRR
jgi:hypothetical protein